MVTAIVMINAATQRITDVAAEIAELPGVSEVYSVAGGVDIIAIVRVREFDELASVVADGINKVDGVLQTDTHVAFRTYSQHDLDATFAIGFSEAD